MTEARSATSRHGLVYGAVCAGVAIVPAVLFSLHDPTLMLSGLLVALLAFFSSGVLSWRLLVDSGPGGPPIRGAIAGAATGFLAVVLTLILIAILLTVTEGADRIPAMLIMVAPFFVVFVMPAAMVLCALIGWVYARSLRTRSEAPS